MNEMTKPNTLTFRKQLIRNRLVILVRIDYMNQNMCHLVRTTHSHHTGWRSLVPKANHLNPHIDYKYD